MPALAGIALIPLLAALARRVGGDVAGLWAAAFVALLPATLLGAENARMYSLAGMLVVGATLLLWRATERAGAARSAGVLWAAYGVVAAAAVWTDYFAALALAGALAAMAMLRPGRRTLVAAGVVTAAALASIGPWFLFAHAQFEHAGQVFWIPPLGPESVAGTFGQLFAGPPIDPGVPGRELLIALQVLAVAAGSAALAGAAFAWRHLSIDGRRAAGVCLVASGGVIALAVVSVWRPILEARYASVIWLPLFALAGVGLAAFPRRVAAVLVAAVAVPSLALGTVVTHPQTASLLPAIETRLGPHDLVATDPNHYLSILAEGGPAVRSRLHVLAESDPPWYFGTAAYPSGAVIRSVPQDVAANAGLIYFVADPASTPAPLPAGYRETGRDCRVGVCLTVYEPPG